MNSSVVLTELEEQILLQCLTQGGFPGGSPESEMQVLMSIIDKADQLLEELDAYEEADGNLLLWFYNQTHDIPFESDDSDTRFLVD